MATHQPTPPNKCSASLAEQSNTYQQQQADKGDLGQEPVNKQQQFSHITKTTPTLSEKAEDKA
jgi:hypothetical protein